MIHADLVLQNGRIFTADGSRPFVSGVAVSGGRIAVIGEVSALIGPSTEVVDLDGGLATPGFTDAHVHAATSGLDNLRVKLADCATRDSVIAEVGQYATDNPDLPWIIGSGWSQALFDRGCPDAALLDSVVRDRPVLLTNRDGHGAWANSKALEIAGIEASTPDPADGRIERLPGGGPQGTLHEGATFLVERHAPKDTVDDFTRGLVRGQEYLIQFGITGWQDAAVTPEVQDAYLNVAESGRLVGDVVGALWWDRHRGLEQLDELRERRLRTASRFRPTAVKLMLDGVAENFTASTLDPYLDASGVPTANTGIDFIDPEELKAIVTALDGQSFQCHFHALGDGAVRSALDAIEVALKANGAEDNRHHLAHLQFVHPDDIPRFAGLGAVANAQPLWACLEDYQTVLTRPFITSDRYAWQYPFGSIARSGARLAMGSDWGVSTADVMKQINVAITRSCSAKGEALHPDQALTPEQALTAFTLGSAFVNHSEGVRGSIEIGKQADFAVLDGDPLKEGSFGETEVVMTIASGAVVYQR